MRTTAGRVGQMADNKVTTIVSANTTQFEAGMARADAALRKASGNWQKSTSAAQSSFQSLGSAATVLAGVVGGISLGTFARDAINAAGELQTLSERTGVSASVFSALKFDIQDAGGTLSGFAASLGLMQNSIGELAKGTKSAVDNFAQLGLTFSDLQGLSPEQQFYAITQAIGKLGTEYEKTEAARNIFGRGAASLIPIINATGGAVGALVDQQVALGNALSAEQIKRLDDFGDAISRAGVAASNSVAGSFADLLSFIDELDARLSRFNRINGKTARGAPGGASAAAGTMAGAFAEAAMAENERRRNAEIADYLKKAQKGGFATEIKRGNAGVDLAKEYAARNPAPIATPTFTPTAMPSTALPTAQKMVEVQKESVKQTKAQQDANAHVIKQQEYLRKLEQDRESTVRQLGLTFSSAFEDAIVNGSKLRDVLQGIASDLLRLVVRKQITEPIFGAISGKGGLLSGFGKILGFANGGMPPVNRPSVVGERGPELFVPRASGTIIPNHALGGGGGNVNVIVNNNAQASVSTTQQANGNGFDIMVQIDQLNADLLSRPNSRTSQALSQRMQQRLNKR